MFRLGVVQWYDSFWVGCNPLWCQAASQSRALSKSMHSDQPAADWDFICHMGKGVLCSFLGSASYEVAAYLARQIDWHSHCCTLWHWRSVLLCLHGSMRHALKKSVRADVSVNAITSRSLRNRARAFITVARPCCLCKAAAAKTSTIFLHKCVLNLPSFFGVAR